MQFKEKCRKMRNIIRTQNDQKNNNEELDGICYHKILSIIDADSRRILENDFINVKEPGWYLDYYSKSTYYRLKNIALNRFIDMFERLKTN